MRLGASMALLACTVIFTAQPTAAQELYFYPSQGQSQDQQNRDFGECHAWAVEKTGHNPMAQQAAPPQEASEGGVLRGAARGAAGGAIIGAITGDAGKGAAIGAAGGGLIGGFRRSDQRRRQEHAQNQHQQQRAAERRSYNRAVSACMKGRGYSVG